MHANGRPDRHVKLLGAFIDCVLRALGSMVVVFFIEWYLLIFYYE